MDESGGSAEGGAEPSLDTAMPTMSGDAPGGGGGDTAAPAAATPDKDTPAKYKFTHSGKDAEWTNDELLKFAGDDHMYTVNVGGAEEQMSRANVLRNAGLGGSAMTKMREAADLGKKHEAERQGWIDDPSLFYAARGVDPLEDAISRVRAETELEQLMGTDPRAYAQKMLERGRAQEQQQKQLADKRSEAAAAQKATGDARKALYGSLPEAFKALGMPFNNTMQSLAIRHLQEAERAGHKVDGAAVAAYVQDGFQRELRAHLAGMDADQVLSLLGDGAAKMLRTADLKRLKATESTKAPARAPRKQPPAGEQARSLNQVMADLEKRH